MNLKRRLELEGLDRETMIYSLTREADWPVKKAARMTKEQAGALTDKELYFAFRKLELDEEQGASGALENNRFLGDVAEQSSKVTATIWFVCSIYLFVAHAATHILSLYALYFLGAGTVGAGIGFGIILYVLQRVVFLGLRTVHIRWPLLPLIRVASLLGSGLTVAIAFGVFVVERRLFLHWS